MRRSARGDSDRGATAVALGLVVTLILAATIVVVAMVGRQVFTMYNTVPSF
jgi:hypothetical protein